MFVKRATPPAGQRRRSSEKIAGDRRPSFEVDPELIGGTWTSEGPDAVTSASKPVVDTQKASSSSETKVVASSIPKNTSSEKVPELIELRTISTSHMEKFLDDMNEFSAQFESQNLQANASVASQGIAGASKFQEKVAMSQQKLAETLQQQNTVESSEQGTKNDLLDFHFDDSILKDIDDDLAGGRKKSDDEDAGAIRRFLPSVAPKADKLTLPLENTASSDNPFASGDTDFLTADQFSSADAVDSIFGGKGSAPATAGSTATDPLQSDFKPKDITAASLAPVTAAADSTATGAAPAVTPTTTTTAAASTTTAAVATPVIGKVVAVVDQRSGSPLRQQPPAQAQAPGSPSSLLGKLSAVPKLFIRKTYDDDPISDSEDGPEEGSPRSDASAHLSAILTKVERDGMTKEQKTAWKCKQDDLLIKRADFHGAVTYAFDGIFSWSMYGATEAKDTNGKPYTEYLMRCQWGTEWSNMEPWIVARRYSEFESLHNDIRDRYFSLFNALPQFPSKTMFGNLSEDTVKHRRDALEKYMTKIVTDLPTILRSRHIDIFLSITERVAKIRENIFKAECGAAFDEAVGTPDSPTTPFEQLSGLIIPARSMSTEIRDGDPSSSKKRSTSVGVFISDEVIALLYSNDNIFLSFKLPILCGHTDANTGVCRTEAPADECTTAGSGRAGSPRRRNPRLRSIHASCRPKCTFASCCYLCTFLSCIFIMKSLQITTILIH